jgi:hypothetical protein
MENIMGNIVGILIPGIYAVLFIGLGLPLAYRKVKRNHFYGYRISSYVMDNDDIWYAVNELGGKHMVIIGCINAIIAVSAAFFIGLPGVQDPLLIVAVISLVGGIAFSLWKTLSLAYKMAKEKGLRK